MTLKEMNIVETALMIEFYLPMENQVRTKVVITKEKGIEVFQQDRKTSQILRVPWKRVGLDNGLFFKIKKRLEKMNKEKYKSTYKEALSCVTQC